MPIDPTIAGDTRFAVKRRRCRVAARAWGIYDHLDGRWLEIVFMSQEDATSVAASLIRRSWPADMPAATDDRPGNAVLCWRN